MITEYLMSQDPTLTLHNEGEWSKTNSLWSAYNDAGLECEVGEFLFGLIRMMKPDRVLETGTHFGVGASYMGEALLLNGKGKLTTIEYIPEIQIMAYKRLFDLKLLGFVESLLMDVAAYQPDCQFDMVLLDTEPQTRFAEFLKFYPHVKEGGYIFIHDLPANMCQGNINPDHPEIESWPFGNVPSEMKELLKTGRIVKFHFSTPRGLVGFYKVKPDDYQ